ncbi:MAG: beta-hexosaminidase [Bacilli bacterium]|nr:beta-hexosaminidase [Bacilli bacterium]
MKKILIPLIIIIVLVGGGLLFQREYGVNLLDKDVEDKKKTKEETNILKGGIFEKYYTKANRKLSSMTLEEKVGQLFLVRYNKDDVEYLSNFNPGGYILFAKDFENHTKESMKKEIDDDQQLNKYPLIIGVDEEGGTVTRVSRFESFRNERFKSPKAYYEEGGLDLLEQTETEKATLLKELGINLNLAPVADVTTNPNDFIYNRTFGFDFKTTSTLIKKMVDFANKNGINSCLKHFPGYGNNVDTHTGVAIDNRSYESFVNNDFLPFKAGIEAKVPSVLVSHNIINALDSEHPASLSSSVIKELRTTLNHTGIIMTDDLAMDAVKSYVEDGKAATLAIQAGNDMIITSDFISMYKEVLSSIENGTLKEETINQAALRIIAWKYYSNLF